jgi:hypothetical protein
MDYIRPIGPVERDIDPVYRIERAGDEPERRDREQQKRKPRPEESPQPAADSPQNEGPVEGDDGHLHIDVRA